jgi:hypothetical protein
MSNKFPDRAEFAMIIESMGKLDDRIEIDPNHIVNLNSII